MNMNKTKVMINAERQKVRQKAVRWPRGVCSKDMSEMGTQEMQSNCTGNKYDVGQL